MGQGVIGERHTYILYILDLHILHMFNAYILYMCVCQCPQNDVYVGQGMIGERETHTHIMCVCLSVSVSAD